MKIYIVLYDIDGFQIKVLGCFYTYEDAKKFAEKWFKTYCPKDGLSGYNILEFDVQ